MSWTPSSWKYYLTPAQKYKVHSSDEGQRTKTCKLDKTFKYKYNIIKDQTTSSQIIAYTITNTNSSILYIYIYIYIYIVCRECLRIYLIVILFMACRASEKYIYLFVRC